MTASTAPRVVPAPRSSGERSGSRLEVPAPIELDEDGQAFLRHLARAVVGVAVGDPASKRRFEALLGTPPPPGVAVPAAAFVTLHLDGELRGCVGSLVPGRPLWQSVVAAAVSAASDPRFDPVEPREAARLTIEVSVLGPDVPFDDPADFVAGMHGLIVERGSRGALMLPEVAAEHGWGAAEMLGATCRKAGLAADAWRDPTMRLRAFRTTRFGDGHGPDVGPGLDAGVDQLAASS